MVAMVMATVIGMTTAIMRAMMIIMMMLMMVMALVTPVMMAMITAENSCKMDGWWAYKKMRGAPPVGDGGDCNRVANVV